MNRPPFAFAEAGFRLRTSFDHGNSHHIESGLKDDELAMHSLSAPAGIVGLLGVRCALFPLQLVSEFGSCLTSEIHLIVSPMV
jgi:hypothetical protein